MSLVGRSLVVRAGAAELIKGVDVRVVPGEVLVVVGPNGAGKSTLLEVLSGDRTPQEGDVRYCLHDGEAPLPSFDIGELAQLRAVVGRTPPMAFDFSVAEVVAMGWVGGERGSAELRRQAHGAALRAADVQHLADRVFATLSSGEQQRVQFARGLLQLYRSPGDDAPRWLLLDEPTSNLDVAHGIALLQKLRALARKGIGVLAVLHDLDLAARFADRVLLLDRGRAVATGTPADVFERERLSAVYGTPVHVEHNATLDRLVVLT